MGYALGDFIMENEESSDIIHSIFYRILLDIDTSKKLLAENQLKSPKVIGFSLWIRGKSISNVENASKLDILWLNMIYKK